MSSYELFLGIGIFGSAVFGWVGSRSVTSAVDEARNRKALREVSKNNPDHLITLQSNGLPRLILEFCIRQSFELNARRNRKIVSMPFMVRSDFLNSKIKLAGLTLACSIEGLCRARFLICLFLACISSIAGLCLSFQMFFICLVLGSVIGWFSVSWALTQEMMARKQALEKHLSEALEVICLGLRSGLSFDFALQLYCECFDSVLSSELCLASREWNAGLKSREQSLRDVASTYDSVIFSRVVENIIRSMRFGSPLSESLEVLAVESRQRHKALIEEKVMKAPVKMMLPVGTLILPSMLILVLGPVILDLAEGF